MINDLNNLKSSKQKVAKIFKGESGCDKLTLTINRFYNDIDLSKLFAYFLIEFSDLSVDKFLLNKEVFDEEICLTLDITNKVTKVQGKAKCQISFEGENGAVIIKSNLKELDIKYSIDNPTESFNEVPSCLTQLVFKLEEKHKSFEDSLKTLEEVEEKTSNISYDGETASFESVKANKVIAKEDDTTYIELKDGEIIEFVNEEPVRKTSKLKTELFADGASVFYADGDRTRVRYNGEDVISSDEEKTEIGLNGVTVLSSSEKNTKMCHNGKEVISSNGNITQLLCDGDTVLMASKISTELSHDGRAVIACDNNETRVQFDDNAFIRADFDQTEVLKNGETVFHADDDVTEVLRDGNSVLLGGDSWTSLCANGTEFLYGDQECVSLHAKGNEFLYASENYLDLYAGGNTVLSAGQDYVDVMQDGCTVLYGDQNSTQLCYTNGGTLCIDEEGVKFDDKILANQEEVDLIKKRIESLADIVKYESNYLILEDYNNQEALRLVAEGILVLDESISVLKRIEGVTEIGEEEFTHSAFRSYSCYGGNLFNGELKPGGLTQPSGRENSMANHYVTGYIDVVENEELYIKFRDLEHFGGIIFCYDSSRNCIGLATAVGDFSIFKGKVQRTLPNTRYVRTYAHMERFFTNGDGVVDGKNLVLTLNTHPKKETVLKYQSPNVFYLPQQFTVVRRCEEEDFDQTKFDEQAKTYNGTDNFVLTASGNKVLYELKKPITEVCSGNVPLKGINEDCCDYIELNDYFTVFKDGLEMIRSYTSVMPRIIQSYVIEN